MPLATRDEIKAEYGNHVDPVHLGIPYDSILGDDGIVHRVWDWNDVNDFLNDR